VGTDDEGTLVGGRYALGDDEDGLLEKVGDIETDGIDEDGLLELGLELDGIDEDGLLELGLELDGFDEDGLLELGLKFIGIKEETLHSLKSSPTTEDKYDLIEILTVLFPHISFIRNASVSTTLEAAPDTTRTASVEKSTSPSGQSSRNMTLVSISPESTVRRPRKYSSEPLASISEVICALVRESEVAQDIEFTI